MGKKICILGATSHIAKGLTWNFSKDDNYRLYLYDINLKVFKNYPINTNTRAIKEIGNFKKFGKKKYDAVINCVGIGDPKKLKDAGGKIFDLTEKFDNLVINYLAKNKKTVYINFSSGAVYGNQMSKPIECVTATTVNMNSISERDYYSIAKINSEAKHRSLGEYSIYDIRVFSYFSRFISPELSFFISDILRAVKEGSVLSVKPKDMIRDFISPGDLFNLIVKCINKGKYNEALDAISKKPVKKSEILRFFANEYGLRYIVDSKKTFLDSTGSKDAYCSKCDKAKKLVGFCAKKTSMDTIIEEARIILKGR